MAAGKWFERLESDDRNAESLRRTWPWRLMLSRFLFSSSSRTRSAPHIRAFANVQGTLNNFVVATIPCWLIGLWSVGHLSNLAIEDLGAEFLPDWRSDLIAVWGIGHDPANVFACFIHGLLYFLPIFLLALLLISIWEAIFTTFRRRPLSDGLLMFAWLFALVMPAGVDLYKVGLGVSFGFVVGGAIYGGSGRYLVNPALLGVTFLLFAYPDLVFGPQIWVPISDAEIIPALKVASLGGIDALQSAGYRWSDLFLGIRPGPLGTVSVLGCLLGAIYLVATESASWRIMLGALLGMAGAVVLFNSVASQLNPMAAIPVNWHLVLGAFAFGVVFFATDPVPAATTVLGRWIFGVLVGLLTVAIRVSNPSYSEGVVFAVLLASLFSPVIDFAVIETNIRRRRRRLRELEQ